MHCKAVQIFSVMLAFHSANPEVVFYANRRILLPDSPCVLCVYETNYSLLVPLF